MKPRSHHKDESDERMAAWSVRYLDHKSDDGEVNSPLRKKQSGQPQNAGPTKAKTYCGPVR